MENTGGPWMTSIQYNDVFFYLKQMKINQIKEQETLPKLHVVGWNDKNLDLIQITMFQCKPSQVKTAHKHS